ncbi:hypothetical protein G6F31_019712 [Rhizopus arrhizus]|nr:hypothetical protein G6F31_019712 [Rhizopus arrhizus]
MLGDQLRAGLDALNQQRAQDQRHHRIARDAQAHRRDEVDLRLRVRRRFRRRHAGDHAGAELLGRAGNLALQRVGHERGDGRARARHGAEQRADRRAPHHRPERAWRRCR